MKRRPNSESGFTLLEMLVAIAVSAVIIAVLTYLMREFFSWNQTFAARQAEHAQFGALVDRLRADEDTAWAIFTPSIDVLGQQNADGHEVDFFTRDGENRPYFWAYRYDASARTITKYLYTHPGAAATIDASTSVAGVTSFKSATYTTDKLGDPTSPVYAPIYAGKTIKPIAIHYGYGNE
ncbi:MAG: prepilin-type N-terminal cleavage/methylation domain-containing protein, partial [Candidatus Eremiobacteraeota bacterium]|nr:prepilin-type N-terminal cleavage/methylation domain-containing protein [Candidatus Eremiobacteraeota bacterium]